MLLQAERARSFWSGPANGTYAWWWCMITVARPAHRATLAAADTGRIYPGFLLLCSLRRPLAVDPLAGTVVIIAAAVCAVRAGIGSRMLAPVHCRRDPGVRRCLWRACTP